VTARGATGVRSSVPSTSRQSSQIQRPASCFVARRCLLPHLVCVKTRASYASMPGLANSLSMMHAGAATTVTGSAGFPMPVRGTAKSHELQLLQSPDARHLCSYHGIRHCSSSIRKVKTRRLGMRLKDAKWDARSRRRSRYVVVHSFRYAA
jgi:hypothetical protein